MAALGSRVRSLPVEIFELLQECCTLVIHHNFIGLLSLLLLVPNNARVGKPFGSTRWMMRRRCSLMVE